MIKLLHSTGHGQFFILDEVRCIQPIDQLVDKHLVGQLDLGSTNALRRVTARLLHSLVPFVVNTILWLDLLVLLRALDAPLHLEDLLQFDVLFAPLCLLVVLALDATLADDATLDAL